MRSTDRPALERLPLRLLALVTVLVLVGGVQALAATIHTDLWLYQRGDTVQVFGEDFGPSETVDVVTTSPTGAPVDAGTAQTDAEGAFGYAFVLDSDESGIFDVTATGRDSALTATTQFDPAHASLSPGSKAFGSVNVGSTSSPQTFTITNTGTTVLNIQSVVLAGGNADQFTLNTTGMSTSVAAGTSTTFSVTFTPNSAGAKSASVNVTTNAEDPTAPLTGTGVATDTTPPTVSMSSAASDPTTTSPIPVTVTFSESVTGFVAGDITTSNGSVTNFAGSGASYTFDLVPAAVGAVTADIAAGVASDGAGNPNTVATQFSRTYAPNTAPTISDVTDQTIAEDGATGALAVTVGDAQTGTGSLTLTGSSSDTTLVPNANITFGGSGASRTVTVVSAANRNGSATITLTVSDGSLTATDTFTLSVTAVNDEPSFTKGADQTVAEGSGAATVAGWATAISAGPSDESGQALTFHASNDDDALFSSPPAVASNGTLTFTPAAGANGSATVSVYVTDDGGTSGGGDDTSPTQTFTVTVTSVNDAPSATDDSATTDEDTMLVLDDAAGGANGSPVDNDTDPEGDTLTVTDVSSPIGGSANLAGDEIHFSPTPDTCGTGGFDYTVSDGNGGTDTGHVTVTIGCVDDPPVAVHDSATVAEDDPATTIDVLANDTDIDGGPMSIASVTQPPHGTVVVAGDGLTLTYEPEAGTCNDGSPTDDLWYTLSPGDSSKKVEVTVDCVNDAPVLSGISDVTFAEDGSDATIDLDGSFTDVETADADATFTVQSSFAGVSVAIDPITHVVTITGDADFHGAGDVTIQGTDTGSGSDGSLSDTDTFHVTVTSVNDAPVCNDVAITTAEDTTGSTAPDCSDPDGDPLTYTVGGASDGTSGTSAGDLTYDPSADFHGSDGFSYTADDGNGGTDTANVGVTVSAVNDAPSATDDSATTAQDTAVTGIDVLGNDTDVDGDTLSVTAFDTSSVEGGTVSCASDCAYTPPSGFSGNDTFDYTVSDGNGGSDAATVTISVSAVAGNDAPTITIRPAAQTVQYSDPIHRTTVVGDDAETPGSGLTFQASGMPQGVTFTDGGSGRAFLQGVADDAPGVYRVTVTVIDAGGARASARTVITIAPEDATVRYTGDHLVFTEPGAHRGEVHLSATISDLSASGAAFRVPVLRAATSSDETPGDVSDATVTFTSGETVLCGPVPVTVGDPADPTFGTAACDEPVTLALGSHDIAVSVSGTYAFSATVGQVEVDRATRNYVTGGGFMTATSSAGDLPATDGSRVSFGFRVRFSPRLTNVRGHANVLFVSDGVTYQVRAHDIDSIELGPRAGTARFVTHATLTDVTDPLDPVTLGTGLRLVVWLTDGGSRDRIAIAAYRGNTLVFASGWNGAPVKSGLGGGAIVVR